LRRVMISPHPTLRLSDVFPPSAQSLRAQNAPASLYLTYNARGAFYQLLLSLEKKGADTVLLPAFHCTALVEPVVRAGFRTAFYRIRPDFTVDLDDLRTKLNSETCMVVVVHFFGFPADLAPIVKLARTCGALLVEDCAHSFLSSIDGSFIGHQGDFALYSYYKFAPSIAGGGLGVNLSKFTLRREPAPVPLRELAIIAKRMVEQVAMNMPGNVLCKAFLRLDQFRTARKTPSSAKTAASAFVDDPYLFREDLARAELPRICRRILESSRWRKNLEARQRNYRLLSHRLQDATGMRRVFPELPDSVCPWAFPVLLENRAQHEQSLRRMGVPLYTFGEILHPSLTETHGPTREDAEWLSSRLLLLPVHDGLLGTEIEDYAKILRQYVRDLSPCPDGASGISQNSALPNRSIAERSIA
jgi:perosamine synthetase